MFTLDSKFYDSPERLVTPSRYLIEQFKFRNQDGEELLVLLFNDSIFMGKEETKKDRIKFMYNYFFIVLILGEHLI